MVDGEAKANKTTDSTLRNQAKVYIETITNANGSKLFIARM